MYRELWRRTQLLEGLAKDSMALANATRRELQEGVRSVAVQLGRYCSLQADKAKPASHSRDNIEATLEEIRTSTSSYFQTIISIQHMFQASCHRIQEHEPMLEKFLAETLERIVGLLTNNKWENQIEDLHRYLKSHHTTVVRNVGHTTNTVLRAANYSSKETLNLAAAINEAREGMLIGTTDIQKSISRIQNEQQSFHQSLKEISATMDEIQHKLSNLSNQSTADSMYLRVIRCEEHSMESTNITSEFKSIFEANQKYLSKEIQNLTQLITDMPKSIGHLSSHTLSDNSEPSKKCVNVLTATSEEHDNSSKHDIISETLEENLNSIFDSHGLEKSSVLHNFTSSHTITGNKSSNSNGQDSNTIQENKNILSDPFNSTFVSIFHSSKPFTSIGQATYLSKDNISIVMSNVQNEHSQGQYSTNTENSNFTGSQKLDLNNKNHSLNEMTTDNPTPYYHDINSSSHSRTEKVSRDLNSSLQHRNTHTQDLLIRTDPNHHSNTNMTIHPTFQMNASQYDSHSDEQKPLVTQNPKNHSEQDFLEKFPNINRGIPRNTRRKNFNKNDKHYLYRLLNKLEELSNRLMNSESSDVSAPDNREHTDSELGSEEYQDYSLPDSTFSSK